MKTALCLALLSIMVTACMEKPSIPRPKDLPAYVPSNATIKQYSDQKQGGLLEISWGHSSMLWAESCRTLESAIQFARSDERISGCPIELDMKIRPLYLGVLSIPLTRNARKEALVATCCYTFKVLGKR